MDYSQGCRDASSLKEVLQRFNYLTVWVGDASVEGKGTTEETESWDDILSRLLKRLPSFPVMRARVKIRNVSEWRLPGLGKQSWTCKRRGRCRRCGCELGARPGRAEGHLLRIQLCVYTVIGRVDDKWVDQVAGEGVCFLAGSGFGKP
jgi:hypothetical protein